MTLGAILIVRQELEILSRIRQVDCAHLYFTGASQEDIPYLCDALKSELSIIPYFHQPVPKEVDWPPSEPFYSQLPYSSLKRVALFSHISGQRPRLKWSESVERDAQKVVSQFREHYYERMIAVHLKNQVGGPQESNADQSAWCSFFKENKSVLFILLGSDELSREIVSLPNTIVASRLTLPLAVQLALCSQVDGFLGMASGLSTAALFSSVPYVLFKHPLHHVEEMQIELGSRDCLPFAIQRQNIWRQEDHLAHLRFALQWIQS